MPGLLGREDRLQIPMQINGGDDAAPAAVYRRRPHLPSPPCVLHIQQSLNQTFIHTEITKLQSRADIHIHCTLKLSFSRSLSTHTHIIIIVCVSEALCVSTLMRSTLYMGWRMHEAVYIIATMDIIYNYFGFVHKNKTYYFKNYTLIISCGKSLYYVMYSFMTLSLKFVMCTQSFQK